MRTSTICSIGLVALLGAPACGSDVDLPSGAGTTGSGAGASTSGAGAGTSTGSSTTSTGSTGAGAGSGSTGSTGAGAGSGSTGSTGAGAGSGSSSTGSSGSSSGGTPPSKVCSDCAQLAIEGPCKAQFDACNDSFACTNLLDCHTKCEWTDECNADCDAIIPSGVPPLSDLLGCIACAQCVLPCAGSTLEIYCP